MNGRKLFREYAQSLGKEAKEFVEIKTELFERKDTLITKNNNGDIEKTSIEWKDMVYWIIKTKKNPK